MITLSAPDCFREAMQFLRSRGIEPEVRGADLLFKKPRGKRGEHLMDEWVHPPRRNLVKRIARLLGVEPVEPGGFGSRSF